LQPAQPAESGNTYLPSSLASIATGAVLENVSPHEDSAPAEEHHIFLRSAGLLAANFLI
jgi:hypothetical protein